MISKISIDNLKNQIDIVDIISSFIELKKSGANFKACCPFHGEDTPSFTVSPTKQIYHCFGCSNGGDAIKFVMEYEKLSYPEAIEKIAALTNFNLEYDNNDSQALNTSILDAINNYYQDNLLNNQNALQYLSLRGITKESINIFQIGYAPSSNDTINYLKSNFFDLNMAKELGVIDSGNNGLYARFIERITFPIFLQSGKLVGFGGRTISGHNAKYVNSPATKLFNKSALLFGYNLARESIYQSKEIIITEGYLDVVMLHQAGFTNSVATLGTALTLQHIPLLKKSDAKVILGYDGDKAGMEAAYKASILLAQNDFVGGVVIFQNAHDPADYVKEGRVDELKSILLYPKYFVEFALDYIVKDNLGNYKFDINRPEEKQKIVVKIEEFLSTLKPVMAEEFKGYAAHLINLHPKYIKTTLGVSSKTQKINTQKNNYKTPNSPQNQMVDITEILILQGILNYPDKKNIILTALDSSMFRKHKEEFEYLLNEDTDKLTSIIARTELQTLTLKEYQIQLCDFLLNYYKKQFNLISLDKTLTFKEKSTVTKEFRIIEQRLKGRNLLPYFNLRKN
ncbi:DNA primase [Poseidonibacter ostreae]|uniref:DNA primase n=1 Tax=Poseidonibacter ostreae TaxID=2654171 RepID=A0A6L4WUC2_9BACT|nr:DNA primase [Poseidonibacter ostreae]KAB7889760.1 DNA primase [Poseidonibacter ostreae]